MRQDIAAARCHSAPGAAATRLLPVPDERRHLPRHPNVSAVGSCRGTIGDVEVFGLHATVVVIIDRLSTRGSSVDNPRMSGCWVPVLVQRHVTWARDSAPSTTPHCRDTLAPQDFPCRVWCAPHSRRRLRLPQWERPAIFPPDGRVSGEPGRANSPVSPNGLRSGSFIPPRPAGTGHHCARQPTRPPAWSCGVCRQAPHRSILRPCPRRSGTPTHLPGAWPLARGAPGGRLGFGQRGSRGPGAEERHDDCGQREDRRIRRGSLDH